jgi:hypothetical protein
MRVFCPEHKRGFFAPRQSPIKCENRGHLLGELDFEGEAKHPVEIQWQYCCNCEHFCPVDFDQYRLERCPTCTRRSSLLYLCDRCHVISFESNTPLPSKNFTLTAEGAPQPSCPGCLRSASADLHEHECEELGVSFITGLTTCPICEERLDVAPAFPSSVAHYVKKTKSAHKTSVTFDYESESFVPVEDGEFVLISNAEQEIVLPRAPRFATRRDFYEFYQDYYHCPNPDAGEVHIIRPAVVARAANGWKLQATGVLEVHVDQPKPKPVPAISPSPSPSLSPSLSPSPEPVAQQRGEEWPVIPAAERKVEQPVAAPAKKEPGATPCTGCGSLIESKYAFCWKCGSAMGPQNQSQVVVRSKPLPMAFEDDELTVQHDMRPDNTSMFSWTMAKPPERPTTGRGSVLKLIAIATIAFVLLSLGLFGLTRSDSQVASATDAPPAVEQTAANPAAPEPKVEVASEAKVEQPPLVVTPEDELKKLREKRIQASASERRKIFQAIAKVERQYPRDYRFPYERAKLAVKGAQASSRTQAFKALSVAAEKAISTGKANEMLSGLEADRAGDFQKLSQGRQEWTRLLAALKRKDTSLLSRESSNN